MVEWVARMVTPAVDLVAPVFRREVLLDGRHGAVASAVLHVSSLGVHEAFVDGTPVSPEVLSPGWSAYEWRLRYRSHDVTPLLRDTSDARSVLTVALGNGWWRGRLGFLGGRALYGDRLGLIVQLEVTYADGHVQVVGTDASWTAAPSDTIADDLYDGQTIDARRREPTWDDQSLAAVPMEFDTDLLVPAIGPPVVRHETRRPERIWRSPSGATLVDFGQNLVGWVRFTAQGPEGSEIRIRHAEVLEDGELGTRPLRDAQATDRFILSGGVDSFEPTFTFHGFRYAEVTGWPGSSTATRSRRWSCTRTCGGPGPSSAPTRCSPSCTATWCGACAATSSTSPPTARSATSGSAGRATSRCSRRRRRTSTTSPTSSPTGWSTSTSSSSTQTALCPSSSLTC